MKKNGEEPFVQRKIIAFFPQFPQLYWLIKSVSNQPVLYSSQFDHHKEQEEGSSQIKAIDYLEII